MKNASLGLIILMLFPSLVFGKNCLTEHVRDAIKFNQERTFLYKKYHGKNAKGLFKKLIHYERLMLPLSLITDLSVKKYHKAGIPILCHDLVDIQNLPFQTVRILPHQSDIVDQFNLKTISKSLKLSLNQLNIESFQSTLLEALNNLENKKTFCLTRHFLESMARSTTFLSYYQTLAKEKGLKDPYGVYVKYMKLHLLALKTMYLLDTKAIPMQKQGTPIFCQDLPKIPYSDIN